MLRSPMRMNMIFPEKRCEFTHQIDRSLCRDIAVHGFKQMIADMLQRDIDVLADLLFGGHDVDQFIRHMGRKGVQQPDPFDILADGNHSLQ